MSNMEDDSIDLNLSSYSDDELRQLKSMTEQVKEHWQKMLVEHEEKLNPTVEKAIKMSIEQALQDLREIEAEQEERKKVKVSVRGTKSPHDGQVSDT